MASGVDIGKTTEISVLSCEYLSVRRVYVQYINYVIKTKQETFQKRVINILSEV